MAKTKTVRLTPEELEIIEALRNGKITDAENAVEEAKDLNEKVATAAQRGMADAFVEAINRTKPPEKKTVFTKKRVTPWDPEGKQPEKQLKRKFYQHGIEIRGKVTQEEVDLLNKLKPGRYCEGFVEVQLRKDRGINIEYPVKTNSQRLRLVNQFGVTKFADLLRRIVDEKENPQKYRRVEDEDLFS
jgi:hypothetical protein